MTNANGRLLYTVHPMQDQLFVRWMIIAVYVREIGPSQFGR